MTMPTMPIDTQQVVDRLSRAGVPDAQARAHASVLAEALKTYDAQLGTRVCTKQDLAAALEPVNTAIVKLEASVAALNARVDAIDAKIDATASALNARIDATASALDARIDATASALDAKIDATASALDAKIDATAARLEARIDAATAKVKSDLVIWVVSAGIFQTSLITALVLNVAG